jgi:hypothetical protein
VSVLRIPKDESVWSKKLWVYFEAVKKHNARPKQTQLGIMMVTNLSSFPSALTVVPVPGGDVTKHRSSFIVNENLKRMGCSGRSALSLNEPTDASRTKFMQLYRTSDKIRFDLAVIELVKLCQLALMIFGNRMYPDGLLCDVTEKGIRNWWAEFGTDFYNVEPNDGTLGPTTVAALLGMVIGARYRLSLCGAPVPKDPFDLQQLKKATGHFQRQQRLKRTDSLDRRTMDRLQGCTTTKSGPGPDIFAVPRAIKSTVADLSARAVGSTSGQNDTAVETVDIERFMNHISGESCKFLWRGKLKKSGHVNVTGPHSNSPSRRTSFDGRPGSLSDEEVPLEGLSHKNTESSEAPSAVGSTAAYQYLVHSPTASGTSTPSSSVDYGKDSTTSDLRKAVFKTMTGRMKDVASGISAGADYVRGRGHQKPLIKDLGSEDELPSQHPLQSPNTNGSNKPTPKAYNTAPSTPKMEADFSEFPKVGAGTASPTVLWGDEFPPSSSQPPEARGATPETVGTPDFSEAEQDTQSVVQQHGLGVSKLMRRKSFAGFKMAGRHDSFFPRRLSFSLAEEAVLDWQLPFSLPESTLIGGDPIKDDSEDIMHWSEAHLANLQHSLGALDSNMSRLQTVLAKKREAVAIMVREGPEKVEADRESVRNALREAEVLGARMEYELGVVQGKLSDLEESVMNLSKFVHELEQEVNVLGDEEETAKRRGWFSWLWGR